MSPTIFGQNVTITVCELLGSIFIFLLEKVKFEVFLSVILTDLAE